MIVVADATPDADRAQLAELLAGDSVALGLLDLIRTLSKGEWDAFMQARERIGAGMPAAEARATMLQERGRAPT